MGYIIILLTVRAHLLVQNLITTTCKKNPGILENVSMEIKYEVIKDPKILSVAREFIKANLPVPVDLSNKPPIDWLNTSISV